NSNYALFLSDIRKEYDKAEKHYKIALESEPNHANANSNYALFLSDIRKEYDKAEKYYKIALKSKPDDADINSNYASFLSDIRKEYDKAEKYYKMALKSKPDDANANSNYAGFLLSQGRKTQADAYMERAFTYFKGKKDLLVELWFYRLAHYPTYRKEAEQQLKSLLDEGCRSIGWDFSANIEQAQKDGFSPIALLQQYADKITKK
ncbi:MAG: SIR2 family protein, partial [Gammaproteobacteria bacterium]